MESDSSTWKLILFIICLVSSGFFSSAETSLMSLSKIKIKHMKEEGIKGAETVYILLKNPSKLLSAILVGNNIVNIGASALATSLAIDYLGDKGVGIATGLVTLLVLIFGEITPKALANIYAEKYSLIISKPIYYLTVILSPITAIFTSISNFFIKLFGGENNNKILITEDEIKTMVDVSHQEGILEVDEKEMIHNVFEFNDTVVKEIFKPRTDMVVIDKNLSLKEIIEVFKREQFSRIPVYEEKVDNIIGILNIKDLIFIDDIKSNFDINKYLRPVFFTYEYKKIDELFSEMKKKRATIGIVVGEYGGVSGLITMEDLIEEIVGDIEDEYDEIQEDIHIVKENEYIVYGSTPIEDLNELIGFDIESEDFDSIGGFIIGLHGGFPEVGSTIKYRNLEFNILEIDNCRIKKIKITK